MNILPKSTIIETLLSINFVCLEFDELNLPLMEAINTGTFDAKEYLERNMKRWECSQNSINAYEKYIAAPNWDNYHEAGHYLLVDKLIHFLKTGEGQNMDLVVDETLRCGVVSEEVVKSVEYYINWNETSERIAA